mmetsp:Transcript_29342/g.35643  ORF Transcript_29342/g.35643 Transcript_29342/m.35643 type:complete len:412 (-) Transcript_29342:362-1597(-)|eukprot:CAMPEP_0197864878 /NCGR_PEP_ID=MMETSP1438-20131217/43341_1 /TAXON_ID=1461541 /ORGANISM="Pterosperma sp., Strain CCMP1384" /LENGTH=411 /DNA_ID=CAMNT_0043483253 /DNA_START=124 /DNA_END=1359 /DNA_ORIENTATION=+
MRKKPAPLFVPVPTKTPFSLTASGTFTEGDLTIGKNGLRIGEPLVEDSTVGSRPNSSSSRHSDSPTEGATRTSSSSIGTENGPSTSRGSANAAADFTITLADLENVGMLGTGSSGVVQKVQHTPTRDLYALKTIQMDMQEQTRKNILQELRILHNADCNNIIGCYGSFFENGKIYFVLEYMDCGSLAHVLKKVNYFSEKQLAKIATQVLEGLSYLHKELHIIHRDIKPSNLLVNMRGEVKISDFGVSGKLANSVADCASWVGTVTYMSPERISGSSYTYDSDIWSLGLTLMECAQGRFPYPPAEMAAAGAPPLSFWDLLDYIVECPPPTLPENEFSSEFISFVSSCLQKDPKSRLTTTELLKHAFIVKHQDEPDDVIVDLVATAAKPGSSNGVDISVSEDSSISACSKGDA